MDSKTKSPNVELFERLKKQWCDIDTGLYKAGLDDDFVLSNLSDIVDDVSQFCLEYLQKDHCRADYREFLELIVIFLGGRLPGGNHIKKPGAIHHARWMAKAIESLKIFILRDQFEFKENEFEGLREFCIFVVRLYVKVWFQTTSAIKAPRLDLTFIKNSIDFAEINEIVSDQILDKVQNHLWYLSEETIAFSFFDDEVSVDEKRKMVSALDRQKKPTKKLIPSLRELKTQYKNKNLSDFVNANTRNFFERFNICTDFLKVDPSEWEDREDYRNGLETCKNIHVVNDAAERAVKLFSQYNDILCKCEEEKQWIITAVQSYKSNFPSVNKSILAKSTSD